MSASAAAVEPVVTGSCQKPALVDALQGHLSSLRELVLSLGEHTYRATPRSSSGSTGEHVRHCLDHARALVSGVSDGEVSYDSRLRGTVVETDPRAAIEEIDRVCRALERIDDHATTRRLTLETRTHRHAPAIRVETTLARELVFVAQHTIHHCATLAVLLEVMGISVPPRFGYAPSTPDSRGRAGASRS